MQAPSQVTDICYPETLSLKPLRSSPNSTLPRTLPMFLFSQSFLTSCSVEEVHSLSKRQDYEWFVCKSYQLLMLLSRAEHFPVVFYNEQDCNGGLQSGWGGAGSSACVPLGGEANSMLFLPGSTGLKIRAATSDSCTGQTQCGYNEGCDNFRANIGQSNVESFQVGC
jgi:hypothetical protein